MKSVKVTSFEVRKKMRSLFLTISVIQGTRRKLFFWLTWLEVEVEYRTYCTSRFSSMPGTRTVPSSELFILRTWLEVEVEPTIVK